jgi:hypothetical protein
MYGLGEDGGVREQCMKSMYRKYVDPGLGNAWGLDLQELRGKPRKAEDEG